MEGGSPAIASLGAAGSPMAVRSGARIKLLLPQTPVLSPLLIALPLGTTIAIYLSEFAPPRFREIVKPVLELLSVSLWVRGAEGKPLEVVGTTLLGAFYVGGMLAFGYALRYHRFVIEPAAGTPSI